jgi:hypothetical protein|tara:strand:- start:187 stop:417 length:231 start_codon:yes stop_codon:yes gene_type:complete
VDLNNDKYKKSILQLSFDQIEGFMSISKQGSGYYVKFNGGQGISGKNLFYVARKIKERFSIEVSAIELKKLFDKNN